MHYIAIIADWVSGDIIIQGQIYSSYTVLSGVPCVSLHPVNVNEMMTALTR